MSEQPKELLAGIRIVDTGVWIAGTAAGALLGDLGAEVIKVEDPIRGDSYRGVVTQYGEGASVKGRHILFESANLNKKRRGDRYSINWWPSPMPFTSTSRRVRWKSSA